jgi:hypothetical protein
MLHDGNGRLDFVNACIGSFVGYFNVLQQCNVLPSLSRPCFWWCLPRSLSLLLMLAHKVLQHCRLNSSRPPTQNITKANHCICSMHSCTTELCVNCDTEQEAYCTGHGTGVQLHGPYWTAWHASLCWDSKLHATREPVPSIGAKQGPCV